MNRENQYEMLVEINARVRVLAALSNNEEVVKGTHQIKEVNNESITSLGYSDATFNSDSIKRYSQLVAGIKKG